MIAKLGTNKSVTNISQFFFKNEPKFKFVYKESVYLTLLKKNFLIISKIYVLKSTRQTLSVGYSLTIMYNTSLFQYNKLL